ncbi:hypothetical protein JCM24511_08097 [Saitozyma sp. JCM 24511]|nr:hypothetical protein JCM24511_08097 [Saitozyma sp. JCM 24511]
MPESAVANTTVGAALVAEPSAFTPLALGSTDVHLLGQLTIEARCGGNKIVPKMIQSFQTPELSVSYSLEIGIRPRNGTVKEAFKHVWGGGLIEVVVGSRV